MIDRKAISDIYWPVAGAILTGLQSRYFRHPGLITGLFILVLTSIVAIAAPLIAPYSPLDTDMMKTLAQPSWEHLLGTDQYGRDGLSRLIWGSRISLEVAAMVVVLSLTFGTLIGAVAGYAGGCG